VAVRLADLLHARRFADVHHAVVGMRVLCGDIPAADAWRLDDDIALLRLEDRPWALADLHALAARSEPARLVLAWTYSARGDEQAALAVRAGLPPARVAAIAAATSLDDDEAFERDAAQLPPALAARANVIHARYDDARHTRRPAVAGVLSALLPGAGQLYAGSVQAAAVTFVLNALFIGATVELARDHDYWTATAAGTVASFFYIGGVINAADLARRRDLIAAQPDADAIEELLLPELSGGLAVEPVRGDQLGR
jgi:TM2 domain-containing membrane protein YozV